MSQSRITLFSPLFLLYLFSIEVDALSFDDIIESNKINIAVYDDYPPYSYIEAGVAKGIDVDIAKEIAVKLNVELVITWMTPGETTEDDFRNFLWFQ